VLADSTEGFGCIAGSKAVEETDTANDCQIENLGQDLGQRHDNQVQSHDSGCGREVMHSDRRDGKLLDMVIGCHSMGMHAAHNFAVAAVVLDVAELHETEQAAV